MRVRADGALVRVQFVATARRMLGEAQPRLRQREPEGLVALVRCRLRHSQAVLRVAAVDVVGTHVYAPRYAFGRNATSQPGQTRDPSNVSGRKSVLQCRIGDIDTGAVAFHAKG